MTPVVTSSLDSSILGMRLSLYISFLSIDRMLDTRIRRSDLGPGIFLSDWRLQIGNWTSGTIYLLYLNIRSTILGRCLTSLISDTVLGSYTLKRGSGALTSASRANRRPLGRAGL